MLELENQEAEEGDSITLRCEVSRSRAPVEWRKGGVVLQPSSKYEMRQEGVVLELCIHDLEHEDNGYYTCDVGDQLSTASVAVHGKPVMTAMVQASSNPLRAGTDGFLTSVVLVDVQWIP